MVRSPLIMVLILCCAAFTGPAWGQGSSVEKAAELLLRTTVTIRVLPPLTTKPSSLVGSDTTTLPEDSEPRQNAAAAGRGVAVCTGTSLGGGLILTCGSLDLADRPLSEAPRYRVTLPDGEQSEARPRVIDRYSGLVLLEADLPDLPGLELTDELPKIGGTVVTAAASGIEDPLVSRGVLSGTDRRIRGTDLPPTLRCDISTTSSSSGAALVDAKGRLIGIIASTGAPGERFGWSYGIPHRYIQRVLEAHTEGHLIYLVRERPTLGLRLGPGAEEGVIRVENVTRGGPADLAGMQEDDEIVQAEGRKIRSVFQAAEMVRRKQPGESVNFTCMRDGEIKVFEITVGGASGMITDSTTATRANVSWGPRVEVRYSPTGNLQIRDGEEVKEVPLTGAARDDAGQTQVLREQLANYEKQLQAYERLIVVLQKERQERSLREIRNSEVLEVLRLEVTHLKRQLDQVQSSR